MADNPTINEGSGGASIVVATDDDGTAQHQYVKMEWGPNNTQTPVNTGAAAVPVQDGGNSITVDQATGTNLHTVVDSGTITAVTALTNALPAGTNAIGKLSANTGVIIGDVNIVGQAASATVAQVASSASNVTLLASSATRKGCTIFNDSTQAVFVKFGATASSTSFTVKIAAGGYWEMPPSPHGIYYGIIDGIWVGANGNAYVTSW